MEEYMQGTLLAKVWENRKTRRLYKLCGMPARKPTGGSKKAFATSALSLHRTETMPRKKMAAALLAMAHGVRIPAQTTLATVFCGERSNHEISLYRK